MPFALVAAALASLGLHVAALFLPDIDLSPAPEPAPLQAEIVLQPRVSPAAEATPSPAPAKPMPTKAPGKPARPVPRRAAPGPLVEVPPAEVPTAASASAASANAASAPVEAVSPPPPAAVPEATSPQLPEQGTITYDVYRGGEPATLIGAAEHRWEMAGGRYRIVSVMETTGVAAWLRAARVETESSGRLVAGGLQPERYVSRRRDRDRVEQVEFDAAAGLLRFGNGATTALPPGTQDLLSFNYQLGWLARTGDMAIATGRKLGTYRLELLGKEWVETPELPIWALHFRASGETTTEVWLAVDQYLLPVKIRHIDKKGERFEQIARDIRLLPP